MIRDRIPAPTARNGLFAGALAAGLLLRLLALPLPGTTDVNSWKIWSYAASHDVTSVYGIGGNPPIRGNLHYGDSFAAVDYPPVAIYELAVVGLGYRAWRPGFPDTPALTAVVKLPGLIAGIALTIFLYAGTIQLTGRRDRAQVAALAYWLNPAILLNAEVLGYLDPLLMLPALASFLLLHLRRFGWAGACLAVALLTKPQALVIVPAFALALWHTGKRSEGQRERHGGSGLIAAGVAAAVTAVVIIAPYILVGALPNMWLAFEALTVRRDILSGQAANVWWIANYLARAFDSLNELGWHAFLVPVPRVLAITRFMSLGLPDPRPFGQIAVVALSAWAIWRLRAPTDLARHLLCAAFLVHAFFVLAVGVHENHQILMVPLLGLAAALHPPLRALFLATSAICFLNLNLFYGISYGLGWAVPRTITLIDATVVLSILNTMALIWHARIIARESRQAA